VKRQVLFTVGGIAIVFFVISLVSLVYLLHRASVAKSIRDVLNTDRAMYHEVFAEAHDATPSAETVLAYTQGLREIDMSDCPTDFQLAYLDHIHAWESLARARSSVIKNVIFSLLTGTIPNISDEQPIREEIAKTWNEVERIALSYGVEVQKL